jgi:hypothetical protein
VQALEPPDSHHLDAAIGWLGLDCVAEARESLSQVDPAFRYHPDVLSVHWTLHAHERHWEDALRIAGEELAGWPDDAAGWLHRAYALRRVSGGGLSQAWEALLPAAKKFPSEPVIAYNLSCYACQMQQLDVARHWLQRAVMAGRKERIKKMALADEDLQPLWAEIEEL